MPHDKSGTELKVGDRVNVPCLVVGTSAGDSHCNVTLETVEPCHPGHHKTAVSLNAKQVEKVE